MCHEIFYSRQVLAVFVGSLLCLNQGLLQAWTSPFILKISKGEEYHNITVNGASYFPIISPLAMSLTAVLGYKICEKYGRKKVLLYSALPSIVTWITQAFAGDIVTFYVARFFSGISDAFMYSVLPVYVAEVSDPIHRGRLGSILTCFSYLGMFVMNIIGSYMNNTAVSLVCILVPISFFIMFNFIPESPYYYLSINNDTAAKESLTWFKCKTDVEEEFRKTRSDVKRQVLEKSSWKKLLTVGRNRRALLSGIILRLGQQMAGISAFDWYTQLLFAKAGNMLSAEVSAQIYMGMCFVFFSIATFFVGFLRRRISFISSLFICALILMGESLYFYVDEYKPSKDLSKFKWFPVTGMVLFVISASYGIALLPTLMIGELFAISVKAKASAILVTVYGLVEIFVNYFFYHLQFHYGLYAPFSLFASCSLFFAFVSYYVLPETKDKTLEEIQLSMKEDVTLETVEDKYFDSKKHHTSQIEHLLPNVYFL